MRTLLILLFVLSASFAQAGDRWPQGVNTRANPYYSQWVNDDVSTVVVAKSPYQNPYFQPNSNYEPRRVANPEWVFNEWNGELSKPPRGLLEILVKGTYTIKKDNDANTPD